MTHMKLFKFHNISCHAASSEWELVSSCCTRYEQIAAFTKEEKNLKDRINPNGLSADL